MKHLIEYLKLGTVVNEIEQVTGGLLHKMYRVNTNKGAYAVKVLNPEIMKRPTALQHTVNSEKIAASFQTMIPAVAALEINGKQIHELDGVHYMIFEWMEGVSIFPPDITRENCYAIGQVLGKIHQRKLAIDGVTPEEDGTVMFDWEAAGYVNPYQEFLEVVNYWADDGKGGLLQEHFDAFFDAYTQHVKLENVDWNVVLSGSYMGMLGWLEYNLKRALGIETATADEVQLGKEQVLGTIKDLYAYEEKVLMMKRWLVYDR